MTLTKVPTIIELPAINHQDAWEEPILFESFNNPDIPAKLLPNLLATLLKLYRWQRKLQNHYLL